MPPCSDLATSPFPVRQTLLYRLRFWLLCLSQMPEVSHFSPQTACFGTGRHRTRGLFSVSNLTETPSKILKTVQRAQEGGQKLSVAYY